MDRGKAPWHRRRALAALLLAGLVLIAFGDSLRNDFALDDKALLGGNPAIQDPGPGGLGRIFVPGAHPVEYLPVRDLSYWIDHSLWGSDPFGYHLANVLYYLLACLALFRFLSALRPGSAPVPELLPFLATAVFAVHPAHVEVVACVSQRKDILCALFFFSSLSAYLWYREGGKPWAYGVSVLLGGFSILSKGTAMVLPAVILLIDFTYVKGKEGAGRKVLRMSPFAGIVAGVVLVNYYVIRDSDAMRIVLDMGNEGKRIYSIIGVFQYLRILLIPYPLSAFRPPLDLSGNALAAALALSAAALAAGGGLAWRWRNDRPFLSFSIVFFLLTLLPSLVLVPSYYMVHERYLFLPSAGFAVAAASLACAAHADRRKAVRTAAWVAILAMISVFATISAAHNRNWRNNIALYTAALERYPGGRSIFLCNALGREYFLLGKYREAFHFFGRARDIAPFLPDYEFYEALYYYQEGKPETALKVLDRLSSRSHSDVVDVHCLYGHIYNDLGMTEKARESYRRALASPMTVFPPFFDRRYVTQLLGG